MAAKFSAKKRYKITLSKAVKPGRTWLRPGTSPIVSGTIAEQIKDAIETSKEVK